MRSPVRPNDEQTLDEQLASDSPKLAADSTVNRLREELETIVTDLKRPVPRMTFEAEPGCVRAVELAANLAPSAAAQPQSSSVDAGTATELGHIGQYRLLQLLGQGGMGAVYKALHPQLEKVVALKVLRAGCLKGEKVDRFKREMKALGRLDHPHLIRALDAGEADGTHFLVMEYVSGCDLSALLAQRGPLPVAEACELIVQAATGLRAAHSRGMIHRDIKPANLMLAEQEFGPPIVKVLDLGLALLSEAQTPHAGDLTSDGQIMGTIDYMPPEQAQDSHLVDERADIYSLGASLYALLSGGSIFHGRPHTTLMQKLMALATEPIPSLRERRPELPEALAALVHRMVARDPQQRFASMAEVIDALQPFAAGADLSALLSGKPVRTSAPPAEIPTVRLVTADMSGNGPTSGSPTEIVTGSAPDAHAMRSKNKLRALIATAVAGVVLLGAIVLSVKTPHGEVIVEIPDDVPAEVRKQIKINVTGDGTAEVASEANGWKVGIKEGTFNVALEGGVDQVQIQEKQVTVSRKQQAIVSIRLKPLGVAPAMNSEKTADAKRQFAEWLNSLPEVTIDVELTEGRPVRVGFGEALPQNVLAVRHVFLQGPRMDQPQALADEFAKHVKGTTLKMLQVGSPTLTNEEASRFLQLPELSQLTVLSLGSDVIDDGIVESLAPLKKVTHLELRCPKITGQGLSQLRALTSLAIHSPAHVTAEGVEDLGQLPKLTYLMVGSCRFTERHIEAITKLKLENLQTYEAGITDDMLKRVADIKTLQVLALTKSPVTDAGLPELKKLKDLTTLHLQQTKVTAAGIADLQQALPKCHILWDAPDPDRRATEWLLSLKHPPKLDLGKDGQPWLALQPGQPLPTEKFHLYFILFNMPEHEELGDEFVDELAKHLSGSKQLGRLHYPGRKLTAAGLAKLVRLPEFADVYELQISPESLDDSMVADLAALKNLNQLTIKGAPKISGKNLGLLKGLVNLNLMECPNLTPEGLEELQQLPLEFLNLGRLRLTEKHVAAIAGNKKLHRLHAQGIEDSTVAGLANMESLSWLGFENSQITDQGLQELKNFRGLQTKTGTPVIVLSGTKVTADGVSDLRKALPNCNIVSDISIADPNRQFAEWLKSFDPPIPFEVTLADGNIQPVRVQDPLPTASFRVHLVYLIGPQSDQKFDAFLDEFTKRVKGQRLTGVFLKSSTLTSEAVARLTQLPELSQLNVLSITSPLVDDSVFKSLAAIPNLQYVDLTCPRLTGQGLGTLRRMKNLAMLKGVNLSVEGFAELQHVPLEYLQIDGINFTEPYVAALMKFKLTALSTNDVGIDDAILARIAAMTTLDHLDLNRNPVTDAGLPELKKLKRLRVLKLSGTKVTAAGVADLQNALPNCQILWELPQ